MTAGGKKGRGFVACAAEFAQASGGMESCKGVGLCCEGWRARVRTMAIKERRWEVRRGRRWRCEELSRHSLGPQGREGRRCVTCGWRRRRFWGLGFAERRTLEAKTLKGRPAQITLDPTHWLPPPPGIPQEHDTAGGKTNGSGGFISDLQPITNRQSASRQATRSCISAAGTNRLSLPPPARSSAPLSSPCASRRDMASSSNVLRLSCRQHGKCEMHALPFQPLPAKPTKRPRSVDLRRGESRSQKEKTNVASIRGTVRAAIWVLHVSTFVKQGTHSLSTLVAGGSHWVRGMRPPGCATRPTRPPWQLSRSNGQRAARCSCVCHGLGIARRLPMLLTAIRPSLAVPEHCYFRRSASHMRVLRQMTGPGGLPPAFHALSRTFRERWPKIPCRLCRPALL